jgi:simple sugar transport system substrate-binding protein
MYKNLMPGACLRAINLVIGCLALSVFLTANSFADDPPALKAAFVYVTPLSQTGWVHQHDEGRIAAESRLNIGGKKAVVTSYVENVSEGADAERVIRSLAAQGNQIIFTPSFGYMEPTIKVAAEFPGVKFESITGYKRTANVATANARYYEGRYLSGIAAGKITRSNVLGYVAGFPIPEVLQGINAFTLGARSVNPAVEVRVVWLNNWFDPAREREAAITLMNQNADVLSYHTASDAVMVAAQERGKWAIAYHSDMRSVAPDAQLLAVTHHWEIYYTRRIRELLQGQWHSSDVWGGVREGMIKIEGMSPKMPEAVRAEVLRQQSLMAKGRLAVFKGPLLDQSGKQRLPAGQQLSDEEILGMNFLVQGVLGHF